jgi:hypothetical protein
VHHGSHYKPAIACVKRFLCNAQKKFVDFFQALRTADGKQRQPTPTACDAGPDKRAKAMGQANRTAHNGPVREGIGYNQPPFSFLSVSMALYRGLPVKASVPCVLTIGNFDGVHRGHQALFRKVVQVASVLGLRLP